MPTRCSTEWLKEKLFLGSWNAMVSGYAGIRNMGIAKNMFDSMPKRDGVSWNALISGI
ncbi:putative tetratricopeptide-like helical domain superfamily [Helianthus annuus]|nr:putative tetratricopeptide-like helical domain superfamily [Helianthus annuus]